MTNFHHFKNIDPNKDPIECILIRENFWEYSWEIKNKEILLLNFLENDLFNFISSFRYKQISKILNKPYQYK